jgi:phosphotriesterase-related protein
MHTLRYYEGVEWVDDTEEELAARFTAEILDGAESTGLKTGVIKVATTSPTLSEHEERLLAAAAISHHDTGAPILTHCEEGAGGLEQIERLMRHGVGPERLILSHTDKVDDPGYHRDLLDTGANLVYDQGLRDPTTTVELIVDMWETGIDDQILLGTDGARRSLWSTLSGSPGLAWLRTGFVGLLRSAGLEESQVRSMFVDAPRRVLAFDPPR